MGKHPRKQSRERREREREKRNKVEPYINKVIPAQQIHFFTEFKHLFRNNKPYTESSHTGLTMCYWVLDGRTGLGS